MLRPRYEGLPTFFILQCIAIGMRVRIVWLIALGLCTLTAQAQHTVYLIGDAGKVTIRNSTVGQVLHRLIKQDSTPSTILYLGDNLYPKGLPSQGEKKFEEYAAVLQAQVDVVKELPAETYFIPGNHDWQQGGRKGLQRVINQQQWIDSLNLKNVHFLPQQGCPGPEEVLFSNNLLLIILDTQWFLHPWEKPETESGCNAKTPEEVYLQLNDILRRNTDKRIIIAAHHPLITYGEHGGVSTFQDHLFPFTSIKPSLYIPLPVVGSIHPLYRKLIGSVQDTPHPKYKQFSQALQHIMKKYPGTTYVAGHEHTLQYIEKDSTIFIVSGSGVKTSHVKQKGYARFALGAHGLVKISVQTNGEQHVEFWQADDTTPEGKVVWSTTVPPPKSLLKHKTDPQFTIPPGKTVRVKASNRYRAGKGKRLWFGTNYRSVWNTEIEVPVFDLGTERGGLKILQQGGGRQTLSLRLADSTGREWVLRSVEKYPENAIPEMLRETFAQQIVQDQISAAHPFASLVIPPLADAAGVYHANPRVVYIPDDPRLGIYRKDFANTLSIFEERLSGDARDRKHFGNAEKIISTTKVLEKLAKDNDNAVDQQQAVKSRLFDLWLGDWDRHEDQWRWAVYENKKGELYKPIPRDRDQTFFVNQGIVPKLVSRKWAMPMFEGFEEDIRWPSGLSFSARYFDRTFLTQLSKDDWIEQARALKASLTDEVIEASIRQWPSSIFDLNGAEIIRKLKARRDRLEEYAVTHYEFVSREVNVAGSDKREHFEVNRKPDGTVHVRMYKITKEGVKGKVVYDRIFHRTETKEIRLYGLGGNDVFDMKGETRKSILVRIIGGNDTDVIADSSRVSGLTKKTLVYDVPPTAIEGKEAADHTSTDPTVNQYDRTGFQYNRLAPLVYGHYNFDDGVFLGGGFIFISHGFRKSPFKQRHLVLASMAPLTASYNFRYQGKFNEVVGKWGLDVDANIRQPNFVNNFFGLGNETEFDKQGEEAEDAIRFYRFRFEEILLEASASYPLGNIGSVKIGPALQRIEVEEDANRFISEYALTLPDNLFNEFNTYAGVAAQFLIDKRNHPQLTTKGIVFNVSGRSMKGVDRSANSFSSWETSVSFYQSFKLPARVTYALRAGAGITHGDYEFYQAQILDGRTELRGFRKTRFYGDSKLYFNNEIRIKLLSFRSYLFPAHLGILGFYDVGRVWYKDATGLDPSAGGKSSVWHKGFGGGVWFTPFNITVLSTEVGHSTEGTLVYVRLGFLF